MSEGKERNTQSGGDERFQRLVLEKKKSKKKRREKREKMTEREKFKGNPKDK